MRAANDFFSLLYFDVGLLCLPPENNLDPNWRGNAFVCKNDKKYIFIN
jgi:hypothetical protein